MQKNLYHNFIDFKKAFDRVWYEGLWHTMNIFGISYDITASIKALYANSESSVLLENNIGDPFKTYVVVRQGCPLSPVLFNIFLEQIMSDNLLNHHSSISIGGIEISRLRFSDEIDLISGSNDELQQLTNSLSKHASDYVMEISFEKSKIMVNSRYESVHANIRMNG